MKRYLLVAAASAALISSPAAARDHSAYFGLEVGAMFPKDSVVRDTDTGDNLFRINYKTGVDGDLIAGYDFGLIRAEFEAAHKWVKHSEYDAVGSSASVGGHGHTSGYSTMGNLLLDFGHTETVNFYVGGGAGLAWMHARARIGNVVGDVQDNQQFAWQAIAGVRAPVFRYFDVGLKYRYFNAGHLRDNGLETRFVSHSLLASLIYNFAELAPPPPPPPPMLPPPPPPPPPAPATQTCADGSVILATSVCPAPPPPPPPAPAQRGERG
jgi:opacity protein-like surface antigen